MRPLPPGWDDAFDEDFSLLAYGVAKGAHGSLSSFQAEHVWNDHLIITLAGPIVRASGGVRSVLTAATFGTGAGTRAGASSGSTESRSVNALAATLEPVIGQVFFSPECHSAYEKLGFAPSPGTFGNGVAAPDGAAYFTSRGSLMGQVAPQVVAAAFAVFNPEVVVPCVEMGWGLTDAPTIFAARRRGAAAQLARVLGERPDRDREGPGAE